MRSVSDYCCTKCFHTSRRWFVDLWMPNFEVIATCAWVSTLSIVHASCDTTPQNRVRTCVVGDTSSGEWKIIFWRQLHDKASPCGRSVDRNSISGSNSPNRRARSPQPKRMNFCADVDGSCTPACRSLWTPCHSACRVAAGTWHSLARPFTQLCSARTSMGRISSGTRRTKATTNRRPGLNRSWSRDD